MLNIIAGSLSVGVAPSTNSYESIATVTVGSGGATDVTFSSIPATYTHLQLRIFGRNNAADDSVWNLFVNFNSDTGSNYTRHLLYGNGSTAAALSATSQTKAISGFTSSSTNSIFAANIIDILDYANTNKYKTVRNLYGADQNGSGSIRFESNLWLSTSAISTIVLTSEGSKTFTQYSSFALYGIKGS